eukprot:XP_003730472.1 PREDICTED: BTB/POZ domain-containing protein KCTD6-like [Strongylocentrotus purpuratus]
MTDVVSLNVGGTIYTTSRATLTRFPDSMLGSMFSDRLPSIKDDKGNYLIDGDGSLFRYVLNFLRRKILVLPEDFKEFDMLAQEADYYQIKELIDAVARAKERVKKQEFLEVECSHDSRFPTWEIFCRSEILQKIPVLVKIGFVKRPCITGTEENGFSIPSKPPLNRVNLFMQITQLGFKLVSVSSSGKDAQARVDRWVFTRDR